MYRQHLTRLVAGKPAAGFDGDDDAAGATPGGTSLAGGLNGRASSPDTAPLVSEFVTPAQAKAMAALAAKEEAAAKDAAPIALHSSGGGGSGASHAAGSGGAALSSSGLQMPAPAVAVGRKAFGSDGKDGAGVALDVSAVLTTSGASTPVASAADGAGAGAAPAVRRPIIAAAGGGGSGGKLGATKLGAKKLGGGATTGAVRLSTGGFDWLDAEKEEAAAAAAAAEAARSASAGPKGEEALSKALAQVRRERGRDQRAWVVKSGQRRVRVGAYRAYQVSLRAAHSFRGPPSRRSHNHAAG
jgi:hypothetical protein